MVVLWLILLASTVMANADLSLEQLNLQYKSEEAEHLQQTLEIDYDGKQMTNEFQLYEPSRATLAITSAYTISSALPQVIVNNGVVRVIYSTTSTPQSNDFIGAFSPANTDFKQTAPVKYALCSTDPGYMSKGMGGLNFNFTNLRSDISFHYFTATKAPGGKFYPGTFAPILVATSPNNVTFASLNQPLKPRVVPVGSNDPDTYKLLWSSAVSTTPTMFWGNASGSYQNTVTATTSRVTKSQMCASPANSTGWRDLGLIHQALMTGMVALSNKKIYYKFGDVKTGEYSKEYVFHVPPAKGTQPVGRGTRVILFDDVGRGTTDDAFTWYEYGRPAYNTTRAVGYEVSQGTVDAVYIGGDISYAVGYIAVWDFFMEMISTFTSGALFFTNLGNHESDSPKSASFYDGTDSGGECGVISCALMPQPYPSTVDKPWWSYDVGTIHMMGMSTEHDYRVGSDQYNWIKSDLASVDRTKTPWIIFGGHRPMYVSSNYGGPGFKAGADINVMNLMIANIEPLLFKYRVNVAFYGHNHVVQRQSAVFNKTVVQHSVASTDSIGNTVNAFTNPSATVHMVIGTGGAGFTKNAIGLNPTNDKGLAIPVWNENYFYKWGYARVEAVNATYLDWKWVEATSGTVMDHITITQSADWNSQPWSLNTAGTANTKFPTAPPTSRPSGPTVAPSVVPVAMYSFSQTLTGVTADQANQAAFKYSFATAIAGLLSIPTSSVVIKIVSDMSTTRYLARSLATASVKILYSVKVVGAALTSSAVQTTLMGPSAQSQIVNTLSASNQGYVITAVTDATVATLSPTASPTATSTAAPSSVKTAAPMSAPSAILPTAGSVTDPHSCFAGSESVTMQNGEGKLISNVQVGDIVLAADASGKTSFSPVVFVPHGANENTANFVHITTVGLRDVKMTFNHIIPAGLCGSALPLVYASKVSVGDCIMTVAGQEVVESVTIVQGKGVYTIVTNEEFVVVNSIIASPFGANHMMANIYYKAHRLGYAFAPALMAAALLQSINEKLGLFIPLFGPVSL